MGDARNLTFGIQWDIDDDPLAQVNDQLDDMEDRADEASESVEQIGTTLQDIGTRASSAFHGIKGASDSMGTSVRGAMQDANAAGKGLIQTLKAGIGAAATNAQTKIKGFGAATKGVFKEIGTAIRHPAQTLKSTFSRAIDDAKQDTEELGTEAKETGKNLDDMGSKGTAAGNGLAGAFKKAVVALGALMVVKKVAGAIKQFLGMAIGAAADAEEVQSKFDTVFKGSASQADEWVSNFAGAAKRSKNEIRGFMADSGAIFTGIGMGEDDAATMSKMMTSLTYDLASFNNLADEDAFAKLRGGLLGETEGLKSMGIILNETAIEQAKLDMGIKKSFDQLDEATKVQVRFNAILAQTGNAQQDVTKTSGSYTNAVKDIKGVWADFLATAGAKFTPTLTGLFNTILDAWPTIEPMLMQLVTLLADGMSQGIPVLLELGTVLFPILVQMLGAVFQVLQPLIPVFSSLANTILPPLVGIFSLLAQTLLPPFVAILNVLNEAILQPLLPVIQTFAQTILPPIAQLLGLIAPILQIIAPVLQVISPVLEVIGVLIKGIVGGIGWLVNFLADGVDAANKFWDDMWSGAEKTGEAMDNISMPEMGAMEIKALEVEPLEILPLDIPDTSQYTSAMQTAMDTTPIMAAESFDAAKATAQDGLNDIGASAMDAYTAMEDKARSCWEVMRDAAADGVDFIIKQFNRLGAALDGMGAINITASGPSPIPHNDTGTKRFPGGMTYVNERGGELAVLPDGSEVVPADQTDRILRGDKGGKSLTLSPTFNVQLGGTATEEDKAALEEWLREKVKELARVAMEEMQDEDAFEANLQGSFA